MPELSRRRRVAILATCCLSLFLVGLDNTIVNVALPSLGKELDAPLSGLQWTVDAYLVVLAALLMLAGSMGDRFGRRRVFQIGLVLFTLGSLLCSLAPSLGWLIAFRMMQAVGGSMLNPVAMGIITNTFTDARERAQAIGAWGAVSGVSMALGPVVGGLLVDTVGWRSIFWINVPVGIVAFVLALLIIPESRAAVPRKFDPVGQVLMVVALGAATFGLIEGPSRGWGAAAGFLVLAAVAVAALVTYEPHREQPLIDVKLFRSVPFAGASVTAVVHFAALAAFLFLNTLYLQQSRGYSALAAGALTLPLAAAAVIASPVSGRLVGRVGARLPMVLAGSAVAVSGLVLAFLTGSTPLAVLAVAYGLFGIGHGLVNAPITNTAVSSMPKAQAGVASATTSAARQIGQVLGVAIAGTLTSGVAASDAGFARATHPAWWLVVGIGVVVVALGVVTTTPWAERSARRAADGWEPSDLPGRAPAPVH
ncbi:MFS transporter [Cryptosporangium phraense]|uniref:MFS transporter n=1 Tax=Cryptosporangium phraense TaxID=2593070 RepID=A0A545AUL1_9ACTN|nr:MFS transporter [Cryptosporangium phraense]TQS44993.1 MFS transporter [Cryptosporangium phraense]